jgi:hypothetical protein
LTRELVEEFEIDPGRFGTISSGERLIVAIATSRVDLLRREGIKSLLDFGKPGPAESTRFGCASAWSSDACDASAVEYRSDARCAAPPAGAVGVGALQV